MGMFSVGDLARAHGVSEHCVRRVFDRLSLGQRVGRNRVITSNELPQIEIGLRAAGYLARRANHETAVKPTAPQEFVDAPAEVSA